jgi:hypothetical protein
MATATTREKRTKESREKEQAAKRARLDEIRALALRQGYITEDQIVWQLDESADPEEQVDQMEEVHGMLNSMRIEVFGSEEEAQERLKRLRKIEEKKSLSAARALPSQYM